MRRLASATGFDDDLDASRERIWWHRLGTSALLIGAAIGWTSFWVAAVVAAPVSLALGPRDPAARRDRLDDF